MMMVIAERRYERLLATPAIPSSSLLARTGMSGLTPEGHESENSLSSQNLGDTGNLYGLIDRDK